MPQSDSPRALIGYISLDINSNPYFAIPVYKNTGTHRLEFHILDEPSEKIVEFMTRDINEESYTRLSDPIKNKFQKVLINSPAIFIIVEPPTGLFVGTIHDVREEFDQFEKRHKHKFFFLKELREAATIK